MRAFTLTILLSLLPAAAAADRLDRANPRRDDDCARAREAGRACTLDFGRGDRIDGGRASGLGEWIATPGRVRHAGLLRLRDSFRGEIIRAADRL